MDSYHYEVALDATRTELDRLRSGLEELRKHVIKLSWDQVEYDAEAALRDVWERIDLLLDGPK